MPANSGAITGTKAHKHSAPSADGGFLDDNVTGVTGTSTGSLVYFDASSIAQNFTTDRLFYIEDLFLVFFENSFKFLFFSFNVLIIFLFLIVLTFLIFFLPLKVLLSHIQ